MTRPGLMLRPATSIDREPVLAFCQDTWGPGSGDYLEEVWEAWLAHSDGLLAVAELAGRAAGVCFVKLVSPAEAYLQGMRVDPDYRRSGVATELTRHCLEFAAARGRRLARLATAEGNLGAQRTAERLGFRHVTTFGDWRASALSSEAPLQIATAAELPDIRALWNADPGPRLWAPRWTWQSLRWEAVEQEIVAGQGLVHRDAFALFRSHEDRWWLTWLHGSEEGSQALARVIRSLAAKEGAPEVSALLPLQKTTEHSLREGGFRHALNYLVYERKLTDLI